MSTEAEISFWNQVSLDTAQFENVDLTKKRTVAVATVSYKGREYEIKRDYGYNYSPDIVIFDWEENNMSCDHNRAALIDEQYPGALTEAEQAECDQSCDGLISVTAFRIELND